MGRVSYNKMNGYSKQNKIKWMWIIVDKQTEWVEWVFKTKQNKIGTHAYECESSLISKKIGRMGEWVFKTKISKQNKIK